MRSSLEPQACFLAAINGTSEQKAQLNTLMEEMIELKRHFIRERWIEVDMAWHEHIYEMSANPFLTSFASLFHSVYHTYFTSITSVHSDKAGSAPGDCRCDYPKRWRRGI